MEAVTYRAAQKSDIPWLVARHDELYRREAGFDETFAPVVERALRQFFSSRDITCEHGLVPEVEGQSIGSLFLTKGPVVDEAQLRLFWLEPSWRGKGVGRALLERAMEDARRDGFRSVLVRTYDRHIAAGRLYARARFELTAERPATAFGQSMIEQTWRRGL